MVRVKGKIVKPLTPEEKSLVYESIFAEAQTMLAKEFYRYAFPFIDGEKVRKGMKKLKELLDLYLD